MGAPHCVVVVMDNNVELVSVIIPVHNVGSFLNECIDSVLAQAYQNLEIILVDDGSTDNSGKICDEYAKNNKKVKVYHTKNEGVSQARNTGIKKSSGKYIYFVDADDFLDKTLIEKCVHSIKEKKCDMVQLGYTKITEDGSVLYSKTLCNHLYTYNKSTEKISFICNQLLAYNIPIQPWSFFIEKKTILDNNLFFIDRKIVFSEDVCFSVMSALILNSTYTMSEPLYYFRKRSGSAMWDSKNGKCRNLEEYNNMSRLIYTTCGQGLTEEEFSSIHHSLLMVRLKEASISQIRKEIKTLSNKDFFYKMNEIYYSLNKDEFCKISGTYTGLINKTFSKLLVNNNYFMYRLKRILLAIFIKPLYSVKKLLKG